MHAETYFDESCNNPEGNENEVGRLRGISRPKSRRQRPHSEIQLIELADDPLLYVECREYLTAMQCGLVSKTRLRRWQRRSIGSCDKNSFRGCGHRAVRGC